jgi:nucleotide-binding universal stress UspA family protein
VQGAIVSTIVIGVDASSRSKDAIALGRRLASVSNAHVVVASAFSYSDVPSRSSNSVYRAALRDDAIEVAGTMRDRLEGIAADHVHVRVMAQPSAAHGLHDLAHAEHAAVIVVGSSHTGHFGRVLPGSTGERLLHGSPAAVAIAPLGYSERDEAPIRTIGVAYNGSDEAKAAVAGALALAHAFDADLEIIGVVAAETYSAPSMMGGPSVIELRQDVERHLQASLDAVVAGLPESIKATAVRLAGDPADQLAERSAGLDLLIAGSRGYGPLHSVLVGGVSGRLTRTVQCPTIIVPRGVESSLDALFADATATAV